MDKGEWAFHIGWPRIGERLGDWEFGIDPGGGFYWWRGEQQYYATPYWEGDTGLTFEWGEGYGEGNYLRVPLAFTPNAAEFWRRYRAAVADFLKNR